MKPIVGISSQYDYHPERYSIARDYVTFLESSNAVALVIPPCDSRGDLTALLSLCDGLLIPGGSDINPALYREKRLSPTEKPNPKRDGTEAFFVEYALSADVPFLGICRGMQMANVVLGGSLHQDLKACGRYENHWQEEPLSEATHTVNTVADTPLAKTLGTLSIKTNSAHHQGISELSSDLDVMGQTEDGLVEAFYRARSSFFWGIQWHPEMERPNKHSRAIAKAFVGACTDQTTNRARHHYSNKKAMFS
ncbi:MAG: gamma-glutamyl-gamma-aminobutyrate hydrolase family protein [Gordonibacter sp.]|uniref:gamma-glutamyl-gamma-aminobutyrate hydrolase family protein n=1 Tax=Gordonibacter sp. TaxID=1968902 RepID=UPI002FC8ED83